jgi:DNA-binding CsgD family transcriptional regulator
VPLEIATPIEVVWDSPEADRRYECELQIRATTLLGRACAVADVPPWRPDLSGEAHQELADRLDGAVTAIFERLQLECHGLSPQQCVETAALALDLHRLRQDHQSWLASRRLRAITQVQDTLGRNDLTLSAALQRAAAEACRVLGFDRAMIFRRSGALLLAEATHFVGQDDWARDCHAHAVEHPIELSRRQTEAEMLRRRAAALVTDPLQDPNAWQPIVQKIRTPGYVATPISVRGEIVATLHADNEISRRPIGRAERDALAAFGTGLGFAIERAVLVDRLNTQRAVLHQMVTATERSVEDFLRGESAWSREGSPGHRPSAAPAAWSGGTLTPREREVLELMAAGATNGDIAARLVLTTGTVKTHVKHILRKLNATSRAHAVSIFLQRTDAPPALPRG